MSILPSLKKIYKKYTPQFIVNTRAARQHKQLFSDLHNKVLNYLSDLQQNGAINADEKEVLSYLENHFINPIPYIFTDKYKKNIIKIFYDNKVKLEYVFWNGKKLYFKSDFVAYDIKRAVIALMEEQDAASPHRYLTNSFQVPNNSVVVDVGAAEGTFGLDIIERVKKLYLIEADPRWKNALENTFEPWKDKVEIIYKFASDASSNSTISIDDIYKKEGQIDFIKIDVEGAEEKVMKGATSLINHTNRPLKIVMCTYHNQNDADQFSSLLKQMNFDIHFSDKYILFIYDKNQAPPYLRKGLIRATLNK
ncbi:MAG: FkbM family methyltransferase [Bacteroidota bacterium]